MHNYTFKIKIVFVFILTIVYANLSHAKAEVTNGITFNFTRVILTDKDAKGVFFKATNNNSFPVLIQAWSSNIDTNTGAVSYIQKSNKTPFIVLPPLQRVDPGEDFTLQLRLNGEPVQALKESVYLLSFKAIPVSGANPKNQFLVTVVTNLKVFIRNKLQDNGGVPSAIKKISASWVPEGIVINNPTPYWLTMSSMKIDDEELSKKELLRMIAPMNSTLFKFNNHRPKKILARFIDEYSMDTPSINLKVE